MKEVLVIGTGTMGNGIAHVFARAGFRVSLVGISNEMVENALKTISLNLDRQIKKGILTEEEKTKTLQNIHGGISITEKAPAAELVVEAVFEDMETKKNIFKTLSKYCHPSTVLASNTSSISITKLASYTEHPERVIGMHFMNPVPVMKLVEVIRGYSTSKETVQKILETTETLGKIAVEVNDYPGFISNRILMPMINEAIYALFEGVAGVKQIDEIMKLGMAHPMGPLQLADFIGLDVCLSILHVLYQEFKNPKYAPCPLLVKMVEAENLGVKTGAGFYKHIPGSKELQIAEKFQ